MNLKALTSKELETILEGFDAMFRSYEILRGAGVIVEDDALDFDAMTDSIIEEMTRRAFEDAEVYVNQAVAAGALVRHMWPDGEIGYAPPGAWDEASYGEGAL
jgi:hypothetical protein